MRTVFEMTGDDAFAAAVRDLEDLGYICVQAAGRPSSTGPWLAVMHDPGDLGTVEDIVVAIDPAAVRQV
jgi:hypothetical protein